MRLEIRVYQGEMDMRTVNVTLEYLAARVGVGDHAAFRCLYGMLAPPTLATIRAELPDTNHSVHVVRATFCEVWWMCESDARQGTHRLDLAQWVLAIAGRRCAERCRTLAHLACAVPPTGDTTFWLSLLADRDGWTKCQLAAMLDGRHTDRLPRQQRRPGTRVDTPRSPNYQDQPWYGTESAVRARVRWRVPTQARPTSLEGETSTL